MRNLYIIILLASAIIFCVFSLQNHQSAAANDNFLLVWTSDSYVPPEYEGKALAGRGSLVRVVAAPTTNAAANQKNLVYEWRLNDKPQKEASGADKSVFSFRVAPLGQNVNEVGLTVKDSGQKIISQNFVAIKTVEPEIVLFDKNNQQTVKNSLDAKTNSQISFAALPFFFSIKNLADINFVWRFNNQEITNNPDQKNPNRLVLQIPPTNLSQSLTRQLGVSAQSKNDASQKAAINVQLIIK